MIEERPIYGLMAEFENEQALLSATRQAREAGYRDMDAYTPFPVHGLREALGVRHTRMALVVLAGGVVGFLAGFGMQYYLTVHAYPMNVGGRPLFSWPSFMPVTFELTVLFAGLAALLGMLALNGLPMPYHPVFNVPRFQQASGERFFLCIEATDEQFDREETRQFLQNLQPLEVTDVVP